MTEPEDLEEDLFADLYDGDDNAAPTSTTSALPTTVTGNENLSKSTEQSTYGTYEEEPDTTYVPPSFHNEVSQPENPANGTNTNHRFSNDQGHDEDDVNMTTEHFGSSIKEDG